ncbi:MAG: M14 family zinc carboxypeptidase [Ilumatobacteraceae bacterium]
MRGSAVAIGVLCASVTASHTSARADGSSIDDGATADSPAVRLHVPSYPLPVYPSGRCDDPAGGGLALAPGQNPASTLVIGTSLQGRPIWAEHWGPDAGPQVLVVGQVHGNECTPIVFTHAVRRATWHNVGVWLIPTLNPDGYAAFSRYNAAGVDLNTDGYRVAQPESRALMELTAKVHPLLTLHVHSPNSFVGWFGTGDATTVAGRISRATGLRAAPAGTRTGTNWFLWQGQQRVWPSGGTVLVELDPVVPWEASTATERGPLRSVQQADAMSDAALIALDNSFAQRSAAQ